MSGSRTRPAVIWIAIATLATVYAGWLTVQFDRQQATLDATQARERQLVAQIPLLAAAGRGAAAQPKASDALTVALLRRPDLIPLEPVLGGTFYFLEDTARVLSDRYLYVAVEDGHVMGHILLQYRASPDDGFEFRVIDAYTE